MEKFIKFLSNLKEDYELRNFFVTLILGVVEMMIEVHTHDPNAPWWSMYGDEFHVKLIPVRP